MYTTTMALTPGRLKCELQEVEKSDVILAYGFIADKMDNWYFLLKGPDDSEYVGGEYIFHVKLGEEWPYKAPVISMITPSGRFAPGKTICIDGASSYHGTTYSPSMRLALLVVGVLSIMTDDKENGISHIHEPKEKKIEYAKKSKQFNEEWTKRNEVSWAVKKPKST
jgi:ubiquitin-protein ligase